MLFRPISCAAGIIGSIHGITDTAPHFPGLPASRTPASGNPLTGSCTISYGMSSGELPGHRSEEGRSMAD